MGASDAEISLSTTATARQHQLPHHLRRVDVGADVRCLHRERGGQHSGCRNRLCRLLHGYGRVHQSGGNAVVFPAACQVVPGTWLPRVRLLRHLMHFVQNRWQLFAAQVVAGLATGLIEPAWDTLFTDDIEESSAKHWSIWAGGTHLVAGAAALIGGVVVAYFSFKTLFLTMGLFDMIATVLAWRSDLPKDAPAWRLRCWRLPRSPCDPKNTANSRITPTWRILESARCSTAFAIDRRPRSRRELPMRRPRRPQWPATTKRVR